MLAVKHPDIPGPAPEVELGLKFPGGTDRDATQDVLVEGFCDRTVTAAGIESVVVLAIDLSFLLGTVEDGQDLGPDRLPFLVLGVSGFVTIDVCACVGIGNLVLLSDNRGGFGSLVLGGFFLPALCRFGMALVDTLDLSGLPSVVRGALSGWKQGWRIRELVLALMQRVMVVLLGIVVVRWRGMGVTMGVSVPPQMLRGLLSGLWRAERQQLERGMG